MTQTGVSALPSQARFYAALVEQTLLSVPYNEHCAKVCIVKDCGENPKNASNEDRDGKAGMLLCTAGVLGGRFLEGRRYVPRSTRPRRIASIGRGVAKENVLA